MPCSTLPSVSAGQVEIAGRSDDDVACGITGSSAELVEVALGAVRCIDREEAIGCSGRGVGGELTRGIHPVR